jgi:hypothetical protein
MEPKFYVQIDLYMSAHNEIVRVVKFLNNDQHTAELIQWNALLKSTVMAHHSSYTEVSHVG